MKNPAVLGLAIALTATLSFAGDWAVGAGSGPFVFGNFMKVSRTISNGESTIDVTTSLSAHTRPGAMAEVERFFNDRFSARLEGTFTKSPLAVKTSSSSGGESNDSVSLDIGDLDVATFALSGAFRFNRGGSFRPLISIGPAIALYNYKRDPDSPIELFSGTRARPGGFAAAGLEWWWKKNLWFRGEIADIVTQSPIERSDFGGDVPQKVQISAPHNVHTSVTMHYRF